MQAFTNIMPPANRAAPAKTAVPKPINKPAVTDKDPIVHNTVPATLVAKTGVSEKIKNAPNPKVTATLNVATNAFEWLTNQDAV